MALPLTDDAQRKIGRATISGRQLRIKKDRGPSRRNHESADRRESRHRDRRAGEEEPFENRRDGKTFRDKKRRLGKRSRDFASHSRGRNGFKRKRFH